MLSWKGGFLGLKLQYNLPVTSELVHKIYWYYWILKEQLSLYTKEHEILANEWFYGAICKVFAVYSGYFQAYSEVPQITTQITSFVYSVFDYLTSERADLVDFISSKFKRDKQLEALIPTTKKIGAELLDILLKRMSDVMAKQS